MSWKVYQGLSLGAKNRPVATVTGRILFEAGQITLLLGENGLPPSQNLPYSERKIWTVPATWCSKIRMFLQKPKFISV